MGPFSVVTLAIALPWAVAPADTVELYDNLGSHHHAISTDVPAAQQYFDQGLRLSYAFNHAEAIRAYQEAARLDPECAICWWGVAYAYGPNINAAMDSASGVAAYAAIQEALKRKEHASEAEQAYIDAMAQRYAAVPPAARAALDSAYANAMDEVTRAYPEDADAAAIWAESRMDLRPWRYWTADGQPEPGTEEIVTTLESILSELPDHPGACHFYIHAVEAVHPDKAVACAERLAALMPGAGHIVHMPAHIYIRVGRYGEAVESNIHAVHTDETFIADVNPAMNIYPGFYYPHNYHFLSFASMFAGQGDRSVEAARKTAEKMPLPIAQAVPDGERLKAHPHLTLAVFGRWDEVLAEPRPAADLPLANGLADYARGMAFAATGRLDEARATLDTLRTRKSTEGWPTTVLEIADHALQGEIAARSGDKDAAVTHYRAAADLEDGLTYTEPAFWNQPVRWYLGDALLAADRAPEAEAVYRENLVRFPENGWGLYGLARALEAQGKSEEAAEVTRRFEAAWQGSDVTLTSSRL